MRAGILLGMLLMSVGSRLQAAEPDEKTAAPTTEQNEEGLLWDLDGNGQMSEAEQQVAWLKTREKRKSPFIPDQEGKEPLKPSKQ